MYIYIHVTYNSATIWKGDKQKQNVQDKNKHIKWQKVHINKTTRTSLHDIAMYITMYQYI